VLPVIILIQPVAPNTTCPSASTTWQSYQVTLDGLGSYYFSGNAQGQLAIIFTL